MKKILGLCFVMLFVGSDIFAQIELEHEYGWKNTVYRKEFDNSVFDDFFGLKYTYQNDETKQYEIYNEDHSLWKSLHLTTLSSQENSSAEVIYVGAAVADEDEEIGMIVNLTDQVNETSQLYILNEKELLVNVSAIAEAENERGRFVGARYYNGLIDQVGIEYGAELGDWDNYTVIYNALTLEEEFRINHGAVQHIETIENERFWIAINNDEDSYLVYNFLGDLLFTIPLPYAFGTNKMYGADGEHMLSKKLHNTDDEYELLIGYLYDNSFPIENKGYLLSQDGTIIQAVDGYSFTAEKNGANDKKIIALMSEGIDQKLLVYAPGMTETLQEYSGPRIDRYRLDGYGEMLTSIFSELSPTVVVYHEDGTIWEEKEINSVPGTFRGDVWVSQNTFNDDASLEYTISNIGFQAATTTVVIETSAGENLFTAVGGDLFEMDFIAGEANKLIIRGTFSNVIFTGVYSTPSTLPFLSVNEWDSNENIRLYPNPANQLIHLNLDSETRVSGELMVFDMVGKLVLELSFDQADVTLSVDHLNAGIYNVLVKSGNTISHKKFIKM